METETIDSKTSTYTSIFLVFLAVVGLIFRATLYWRIPVEPGEPAGLGDVIELAFYFAIIGVAGFVLLMSVIVALRKNFGGAIRVFLVGVITPVAYYALHSYVPRLM